MAKVTILVEVDESQADVEDSTGLTSDAYDKLTDPMGGPLGWLGEVIEVVKSV